MVDVVTPIIIDGVHVANFFIGQFFFKTPDKDFFIKQAYIIFYQMKQGN
jgi:hypothetical protein